MIEGILGNNIGEYIYKEVNFLEAGVRNNIIGEIENIKSYLKLKADSF